VTEPAEVPPPGPGRERGRTGLATKLILLCTVLALATVSLSLLALGIEVRRQTRRWMTDAAGRQQAVVRETEAHRLEQLLRTSHLLTESPTLRAALEVWRTESRDGAPPHPDLVATVAAEADRVAATSHSDLLVLTDDRGRTLAAAGPLAAGLPPTDLSGAEVVRAALAPDGPLDARNLDVLSLGDLHYRVGAVPILLQGYVIGSLVVGEAIDDDFLRDWRESFAGDVVLTRDGAVIATSLPALAGAATPASLAALSSEASAPAIVRLGDEDFVAAALELGRPRGGAPARAYFLHSLTAALAGTNSSLFQAATWIGLVVVAIATLAAWRVSRSVLEPFRQFVGFMGAVAASRDWSRRFVARSAGAEVALLADACNGLIGALEAHERDVRERARSDLERMERLKESEKMAALGRMLSGAAHEINNPLTGVVGRIDVLLGRNDLPAEVRQRLDVVRDEGRRVVALVRRLLHVAHRDTGEREVVDLTAVAREIEALRRHDFAATRVGLNLDLPGEPVCVLASELEMQQVFVNIVGNAHDALAGREGAPALTVRVRSTEAEAIVEFEDNGPGLAEPDKVFEFFYTTKPVGKGTGLGLGICHAIVERAGGTIAARNAPSGGAAFTIALPRVVAERTAGATHRAVGAGEPPRALEPGSTADGAPLAGRSILVVDDEPSVLDLQREVLTAAGALVTGVASGDEAIEVIRRERFDLVVSDLRLPGRLSGKDVFHWIEANRPEARDRFVFVTGDSVAETDFLRRADVPCVLKPFTVEEYRRAIRDAIDRHPAIA
jgi:signal transduction histidine kinase/CheY-like chemotaxis protein